MAGKNEPRRIRVIKNIGTRIKYFPPKRTEGLGAKKRDIPSDEPRRIKVFKGQGTEMRYYPPKLTEGLQRRANPTPPINANTPARNPKAHQDTPPNADQD